MPGYIPPVRRPIADVFRLTADAAVRWCVRRRIHPNVVSCVSIVASAAAGLCFWQASAVPALLVAAVAFCYLRLWLNMLDGMVALASGTASRLGEVANELPDRLSDVIIFVGLAHSSFCHPLGAYWAAILALLTAYVGTLGQAVGTRREFGGVMSKPWRMVALHAGAWLTLAILWAGGEPRYAGLSVLDWTNLLVVAGCVQTFVLRLRRIVRDLRHEAASASASLATGGDHDRP